MVVAFKVVIGIVRNLLAGYLADTQKASRWNILCHFLPILIGWRPNRTFRDHHPTDAFKDTSRVFLVRFSLHLQVIVYELIGYFLMDFLARDLRQSGKDRPRATGFSLSMIKASQKRLINIVEPPEERFPSVLYLLAICRKCLRAG